MTTYAKRKLKYSWNENFDLLHNVEWDRCKQCSFLVNFRLKYKDINKSNKRQTYTHSMGVLGEKCSPKWANFTLKQGKYFKKHTSSNFLSGMISVQGDRISS